MRGYSLNLVLLLSALLVVILSTALVVLSGSARTSGEMIARRQAFFATDGMIRSVMKLSNDYLRQNPSAGTTEWWRRSPAEHREDVA